MYIGKRRSQLTIIVLSIITCGIYMAFWYYTIIDDLNKIKGKEIMNPIIYAVLSFFCFPVILLILYKMDHELSRVAEQEGIIYKENFIIWIIFYCIMGIGSYLAMFQIQDAYNEIWEKREERSGIRVM